MSNKIPSKIVDALKAADLEVVDPNDESAEAGATRISIDGPQDADPDLALLLEDTARFIRALEGDAAANPYEHREYVFKRLNIGDFVIMSNRS